MKIPLMLFIAYNQMGGEKMEFVPTKAVTVRIPVEVVNMLNQITSQTGQTNKETIEAMIRRAYNDLFGE